MSNTEWATEKIINSVLMVAVSSPIDKNSSVCEF